MSPFTISRRRGYLRKAMIHWHGRCWGTCTRSGATMQPPRKPWESASSAAGSSHRHTAFKSLLPALLYPERDKHLTAQSSLHTPPSNMGI